ncbi:polysaccharide deacetylase family protein [Siccirubricoccus sp. KC 17139]|uniref:Chitooligosaccharide deacetylase n=1 Tax=Siccirubricoccus soli TaxID=2899147 RepID=A0ABT1D8S8_9PROT|nr:polysaccharide deacetylase family protein [Siccirubricoccus soli]MCO6417992.1 polysaccharide deacetylase family protein [Siccirubricoccus soli]MCP2684127.1 polysaccharide deacetylase family protein [Siccirubricoccus soli]
MRASLWLHGTAALGVAVQPHLWPFGLALLAGNHALLAAFMHPCSAQLGPNLVRLPPAMARSVAITFDDGPDPEVTPRVLDMLEAQGATASFFVIGAKAARHGALLREMQRRGHSIENHTYGHRNSFACLGPWALRREIRRAQQVIADAIGIAPRFFRAPMGLRSPLLDPVLAMEGLRLVSWTRRGYDGRPDPPHKVLERLTRRLAGGDILLLHDSAPPGLPSRDAAVLQVLPRLLDRCAAEGLRVESLAAIPPASAARA